MSKNRIKINTVLGQSRDYWQNAAKQFIWPIDFTDLQILVPEKDLQLAGDNLMVSHFRSHGWHVQSVIDVNYNKPFVAPVSDKPMFMPPKVIEQKEGEFKFNQAFRIKSTDCELKIISIDKKTIILKYTNRSKADIATSPENLSKSVRMGVWIKL
jgi:hypothetical protein